MNLRAGQKAKATNAYQEAITYFTIGQELLTKDSWQTQYDLTLTLYVEATETAYLSTNFEKVAHLAKVVQQQSHNILDQVKIYEVQIRTCIAQSQLKEAVRITLAILELLGISFPENPTTLDIQRSFDATLSNLGDKAIEDLINLPEMTDSHQLAAVNLLSIALSPVVQTVPELGPLMACQQVNLLLKHGNAKVSALAYSTYGLFLCSIMEDVETGFRFGQLALKIVERFNAKEFQTKTSLLVHYIINPRKEHLRNTLTPLVEAYQNGLATGDLEYAAYCAADYSLHLYFSGKQLGIVAQELKTYSEAINQLKQEAPFQWNEICRQTVLNLMGGYENPDQLIGIAYNEDIRHYTDLNRVYTDST